MACFFIPGFRIRISIITTVACMFFKSTVSAQSIPSNQPWLGYLIETKKILQKINPPLGSRGVSRESDGILVEDRPSGGGLNYYLSPLVKQGSGHIRVFA
jgi:hypothetical protein